MTKAPPSDSADPAGKIARFRALHASGCFLLPNPWDVGSAIALAHRGFQALATTSAGFAFSRGLPDAADALSRADVLAHVREIVAATPLPVNVDFQSGYARDSFGIADSVSRCVAAGCAGFSLEDASGDPRVPLFELPHAVERLRAARITIDATRPGVVLTARCEAWLVGAPNPKRTALDRLVAFADAGADCLYAPGARDPATIAELVRAVAPKPLNVLVSAPAPGLSLKSLADLGVRRVSLGSALARVAWGAFLAAADSLIEAKTFDALAGAAPLVVGDTLRSRALGSPLVQSMANAAAVPRTARRARRGVTLFAAAKSPCLPSRDRRAWDRLRAVRANWCE
jgi:2-methylisocitrate lyase-like PEP mutase family enzyme